jgi:transposase
MAEQRKTYTTELQQEAVRLLTDQRDGVAETARNLGVNVNMLCRWTQEYTPNATAAFPGNGRLTPEQEALRQRREDNKRLKMARDICKNAMRFFGNEPN